MRPKKKAQCYRKSFLLTLLLKTLLSRPAFGTIYNVTAIDKATSTAALAASAGGGALQCAVRCRRRRGCVSIQTSTDFCQLLSAVPTNQQLTASPGVRIFSDVAAPAPDPRVPHECPSSDEWKRVGNAC